MALLLAAVNPLSLRHPMDASFLLALTACAAGLVYAGTLLLTLQHRGDFGLLAEAENPTAVGASLGGRAGSVHAYPVRGPHGTHPNPAIQIDRTEGVGLLSIPFRDLGLLFSGGSSTGYAAYGMKPDLKVV